MPTKMYPAVISVNALENYKLMLIFDTSETKIFDMLPYLNIGRFTELRDKTLFSNVYIKYDSI